LANIDQNAPPPPGTGPKGGGGVGVPAQIQPSPGLPERRAVARRQKRVLEMLHTLPASAQKAVRAALDEEAEYEREYHEFVDHAAPVGSTAGGPTYDSDDNPTQSLHLGQS
jgi:hypothetical protein